MDVLAYIGSQIKQGRQECSLSQRELAWATKVDEQTVRDWEAGKTCLSFEQARDICDIFNWPIDKLAGRTHIDSPDHSA